MPRARSEQGCTSNNSISLSTKFSSNHVEERSVIFFTQPPFFYSNQRCSIIRAQEARSEQGCTSNNALGQKSHSLTRSLVYESLTRSLRSTHLLAHSLHCAPLTPFAQFTPTRSLAPPRSARLVHSLAYSHVGTCHRTNESRV